MKRKIPIYCLTLGALLGVFATQSRADILPFDVQADFSSLSGSGGITFAVNTFGSPDFSFAVYLKDLQFQGGDYGFGVGSPENDVVRTGNNIQFSGSSTDRFFDIPVNIFGSSMRFFFFFTPGAPTGPSQDQWSFSLFAFDEQQNFEGAIFDISPDGNVQFDAFGAITATVVPEPAAYAVLLLAVGFVAWRTRRNQRLA